MAYVPGFPTDDLLDGTAFDDLIEAFEGNDTIYAGQGDDSVLAGDGNDYADGYDGNDTLFGGRGSDTLLGGSGSNRLYGGANHDVLFLGDVVYGSESRAWGGGGNDVFLAVDTGNHTIFGGAGMDTMALFWGNSGVYGAVDIDLSAATPYARTTTGPELIFTSIEHLVVYAGAGDDTVIGGQYSDTISVGEGFNLVNAAGGDDLVKYVTDGRSTLDGGTGDDTLTVCASDFSLYFIVGGDGSVDDGQLSVITNFEVYEAIGGYSDDTASLGTRDDWFFGGHGGDTAAGMEGDDYLDGGTGRDDLVGGAGDDVLKGGGHDDTLNGGEDNDRLIGGGGADVMEGGDGVDRLSGARGTDTLTGGAGADTFIFNLNEDGFDLVTDFATGGDQIRYWAGNLQFFDYPDGEDMFTYSGGLVDPALFSIGAAVGTAAQFVLVYHADYAETWLHWDPNGEDPAGGTYGLIRFAGDVSMVATDIHLF